MCQEPVEPTVVSTVIASPIVNDAVGANVTPETVFEASDAPVGTFADAAKSERVRSPESPVELVGIIRISPIVNPVPPTVKITALQAVVEIGTVLTVDTPAEVLSSKMSAPVAMFASDRTAAIAMDRLHRNMIFSPQIF